MISRYLHRARDGIAWPLTVTILDILAQLGWHPSSDSSWGRKSSSSSGRVHGSSECNVVEVLIENLFQLWRVISSSWLRGYFTDRLFGLVEKNTSQTSLGSAGVQILEAEWSLRTS